jgi:hypothetical protein
VGERDALIASGAAEAFETPIKLGAFCARIKELAAAKNAAPAAEAPAPLSAEAPAAPAPTNGGAPASAEAPAAAPNGSAPPPEAAAAEFPVAEQPALAAGLDAKLMDLAQEMFTGPRWPGAPAALEPCEAALLARVAGRPMPDGADAALVEAVYKSLTAVEVKAFQVAAGMAQAETAAAPAAPEPAPAEAPPPDPAPVDAAPPPEAPASSPLGALDPELPAAAPEKKKEPRPEPPKRAEKKTASDRAFKVPPESAPLLTRMSAERLRIRLMLKEADQLHEGVAAAQVDETALTAFLKAIDATVLGIDPAVQRAVGAGELALVRAYNAAKQSIAGERHSIENRARKLRGEAEVKRGTGAGLDAHVGPVEEERKPRGKGAAARVLYTVTVAAEAVGSPRRLAYIVGGVAAAALLVHVFVLDTFGLFRPRGEAAPPIHAPGIVRVETAGEGRIALVGPGFDPQKQLGQVAKGVGDSRAAVMVQDDSGAPIAIIAGGQAIMTPFSDNPAQGPMPMGFTEEASAPMAPSAPDAAAAPAAPTAPAPAAPDAPAQPGGAPAAMGASGPQ